MSSPSTSGDYKTLGAFSLPITAGALFQTGIIAGRTYEICTLGGLAVCRWGDQNPVATDGNFDFAVPEGVVLRVVAPPGETQLGVIEGNTDSTAGALIFIAEVEG